VLRAFRYEEIAADLREQIRRGAVPHGERLPGERAMMERYGVQRNTVRQALTLLQREGWLSVRPRSGAFAARPGVAAPDVPKSNPVTPGIVLVVHAWNRSSTASSPDSPMAFPTPR
jgi:DNA-binding GntR family transcriptional regulator